MAAPPSMSAPWLGHRGAGTMSVDTIRFDATTALIRVTGEIDPATSPPLWAVLAGHQRAGRRFLRLDVSGVTFLDATALSGIVAAHEQLLADRGTLVVTGVRGLAARVLRLTGLDEVLFISGSRGDGDTEADPEAELDLAFRESDVPRA